ncbi:hypothetical protein COLO4_08524 [Corchorus olitorius]|uniref:Uncharacterized protein n=1 Tax=Corchorus olitorius TaxID=93759 RepID=A0A1R3KFL3_9ROSI|nr:hypothetical protein COLO4_08524 [Corchorus olitorius]
MGGGYERIIMEWGNEVTWRLESPIRFFPKVPEPLVDGITELSWR